MSVEIEPSELGFRRMSPALTDVPPFLSLGRNADKRTRHRALHRRGRTEAEAQKPKQAACRVQGMFLRERSSTAFGRWLTAAGQNHRSQTVRSPIPGTNVWQKRRLTRHLPRYCVRPNSGRIEPGLEVEVTGWWPPSRISSALAFEADQSPSAVILQAMKQDPPADAKCRDKFLVQSVIISSDNEFNNVQTIVCCPFPSDYQIPLLQPPARFRHIPLHPFPPYQRSALYQHVPSSPAPLHQPSAGARLPSMPI